MFCARELIVLVAAEFEWENLGLKALDQIIINNTNSNSSDTSSKDLAWIIQFDMRLTLTKRRVPLPDDPENRRKLNEYWLKEDAFMPQTYTVHLDKIPDTGCCKGCKELCRYSEIHTSSGL